MRRLRLWRWKFWLAMTMVGALSVVLAIPWLSVYGPYVRLRLSPATGPEVTVRTEQDQVLSMPMEEYLVGVLAGEMQPQDPPEALKAMAVAARSFAWLRVERGETLCATVHCQVWLSPEQRLQRWGAVKTPQFTEQLLSVVTATRGQMALYGNKVIDATYHASCGGRTESAAAVWGREIPYLQSVSCPEKPDLREARFTLGELDARLGTTLAAMAAKSRRNAVEVVDRTETGRVKHVRVAGEEMEGTRFRSALGLASTDLRLNWDGGGLRVETRGHGHAVGLCQAGAVSMAEKGEPYDAILRHYYPGTRLETLY
ncbi:stage II sporulation protein D [Heliobacterium gestii]|uniref:Stage II sporulation protein D n=1 Tax=Heliomicrobium gestii TaxID=2699 RepID=A0A845LJV5_HELGE|nr:stage II sporulation protein D [Heliomicrobium gestii]MBM7866574.1 stage II sporulation protein D [Heliomicrobium gestii]MZP43146.1 stage II sporulation protein D [Heliomicrobium gestii]